MIKVLRTLLVLVFFFCSVPIWATWSLTQAKDNTSCTTTTCAVTVTSTGSGNVLVAGIISANSSATSISGVSAAACAIPWVHCPNCLLRATAGNVDMSYCLNSASGQTSITITSSAALTTGIGVIFEASTGTGNVLVDTGVTPTGNKSDTSCTSCAGVPLLLGGTNDIVFSVASCGGSCSNIGGAGWTNDLGNPNTDGIAHGLNLSTMSMTWTQTSGTLVTCAMAFQDNAAVSFSGLVLGGNLVIGGNMVNH